MGVFAQGTVFDPEMRSIGDLDTIAITLKFPSGTLALLDLSRQSSYGYDMRVEVSGLWCDVCGCGCIGCLGYKQVGVTL